MSEDKIKVRITAHEKFLIISTEDPTHDEFFVPAGGGRIGCVLINTEEYLGMSEEAAKLMKEIKRGTDAIGDFSTWKAGDKGDCIGWLGGIKRLVKVDDPQIVSSRDGIINLKYVPIENKVPLDAFEAISTWGAK